MTSTARPCKAGGGFTLLEIVITLTIASIVIAGAIGLMRFSSEDRELSLASSGIEALAKRARVAAILHQTSYAVEFTQGGVKLMPLAELLGRDRVDAGGEADGEAAAGGTVHSSYALDAGMELAVRRWNARDWEPVVKDRSLVWRFDPDGLCEPIGLRLQIGENVSEYEFHPLTATIENLTAAAE